MVKVVWTDFAIQDLDDIGEFIAKDSERYAKVVIQNLFESTELLESHPKAGRVVPEFESKNINPFFYVIEFQDIPLPRAIGPYFIGPILRTGFHDRH